MLVKLESLVLRGVAVLCGGKAVNPRLGSGYTTLATTPEIRFSMRHPSRGWVLDFGQPKVQLNHAANPRLEDANASGAGRSLSHAGVLSRSSARAERSARALPCLGTLPGTIPGVERYRASQVWCKPITWTPSASTRGE
jgi:hypothetical protein